MVYTEEYNIVSKAFSQSLVIDIKNKWLNLKSRVILRLLSTVAFAGS